MFNKRKPIAVIAIASAFSLVAVVFGWLASHPGLTFMPHGCCYLWNPRLLWTHVTSDVLIGTSYVAISATLGYMVFKARRELPFDWMILSFGVFIIACGTTHFVEAWTVWHPIYWVAAFVKVVTAAASVITAILLPTLVPRIMSLLEGERVQRAYKVDLEQQIQQRIAAEGDLLKMKETLEQSVRQRTSALSQANSALTLYETIFQSSLWGVAIVDSVRGLIQLCNPAFARMHGYEPDEMIGMALLDTFAPESAGQFPGVVDIVNAQDHLMYEAVHIRKDKTRFPCLTDVSLARDPQGLPLYRFGYYQDITNQKRAEEDIRSVVTHARCILWRAIVTGQQGWDKYEPGTRKFDWDLTVQDELAAQQFQPLNIPPGGTYSETWVKSRHPDDFPPSDDIASKAFITGAPAFTHLFRCFDKFGEIVWIREEVSIIPMGPGRWQCTGVCMDVTSEQKLSERLRQQTELLELTHDAIVVRNDVGGIIYWNSGAEDLYGWNRNEVIGRNIHELLKTTRTSEEDFTRSLDEHGYWAGHLRHTTRDGREIVVDSRHLMVLRENGVKTVLETNHDITDIVSAGTYTGRQTG